jgi:hypothetical protein
MEKDYRSAPPASADIIIMTVSGTVAPYQFDNGYHIAPVIDQTGLFGQVGTDLANAPLSIIWTSDTITGAITAALTINGMEGGIFVPPPVYEQVDAAFATMAQERAEAVVVQAFSFPGRLRI